MSSPGRVWASSTAASRVGVVTPSLVLTLLDMSTTQAPLPGLETALIGLAALVVVVPQILSPLAEHLNVMAHKGTHAITGSILGFGISKRLSLKAWGEPSDTTTEGSRPPPTAVVSSGQACPHWSAVQRARS